jgi:hypothetical protein
VSSGQDAVGFAPSRSDQLLSVKLRRQHDIGAIGARPVQHRQHRNELGLKLSTAIRGQRRSAGARSSGRAEAAQEVPYVGHDVASSASLMGVG